MSNWRPCPGEHLWEPIPKFYGRYKCSVCHCIGYHMLAGGEAVIGKEGLRGEHHKQIRPYKCPKCHGPTTKYQAGNPVPCLQCRPEKEATLKWKKGGDDHVLFDADGRRLARIEVRRPTPTANRRFYLKVRGVPAGDFDDLATAKAQAEGLVPRPPA